METKIEIDRTQRGNWTSASAAQADFLCAGRHRAQSGLPDTQDESSEHGNAIHAALAKQDPTNLDVDQQELYDSIMEIEKKLVAAVFGSEILALEAKPVREQRYWIKFMGAGDPEHSGQVDVAYRYKTKALIIEYKSLAGEVTVSPQNMQLRDQVVLFDHNTPMLAEIMCAVIQPYVTHIPALCGYKREDIAKARQELFNRVVRSNDPNAKRIPGEVQCKWCKAAGAGLCSEYNAWAAKTIVRDASLIDVPVQEWTGEQCALFLERKPIARKWLDDADAAIKERLKADENAVPGYTLRKGNTREHIVNPQAVFDTFSQLGGSLNAFMDCVEVGKGALKTAVAAVTKAKGKRLDEQLKAVIGENHTMSENEPSIVKKKEA